MKGYEFVMFKGDERFKVCQEKLNTLVDLLISF